MQPPTPSQSSWLTYLKNKTFDLTQTATNVAKGAADITTSALKGTFNVGYKVASSTLSGVASTSQWAVKKTANNLGPIVLERNYRSWFPELQKKVKDSEHVKEFIEQLAITISRSAQDNQHVDSALLLASAKWSLIKLFCTVADRLPKKEQPVPFTVLWAETINFVREKANNHKLREEIKAHNYKLEQEDESTYLERILGLDDFLSEETTETRKSPYEDFDIISWLFTRFGVDTLLGGTGVASSQSKFDAIRKDKRIDEPEYASLKLLLNTVNGWTQSNPVKLTQMSIKSLLPPIEENDIEGKAQQDRLLKWIETQVKNSTKELRTKNTANYLTENISSYVSYFLCNLADAARKEGGTDDSLTNIFHMILPDIVDFVKTHHEDIEKKKKELNSAGIEKITEEPSYLDLFKPLAKTIEEQAGMVSQNPTWIETKALEMVSDLISKMVADQYETAFIPLVDVYSRIFPENKEIFLEASVEQQADSEEDLFLDALTPEEYNAQQFREKLLDYLKENKNVINDWAASVIKKNVEPQLSKEAAKFLVPQIQKWITDKLVYLIDNDDPRIHSALKYAQELGTKSLLSVVSKGDKEKLGEALTDSVVGTIKKTAEGYIHSKELPIVPAKPAAKESIKSEDTTTKTILAVADSLIPWDMDELYKDYMIKLQVRTLQSAKYEELIEQILERVQVATGYKLGEEGQVAIKFAKVNMAKFFLTAAEKLPANQYPQFLDVLALALDELQVKYGRYIDRQKDLADGKQPYNSMDFLSWTVAIGADQIMNSLGIYETHKKYQEMQKDKRLDKKEYKPLKLVVSFMEQLLPAQYVSFMQQKATTEIIETSLSNALAIKNESEGVADKKALEISKWIGEEIKTVFNSTNPATRDKFTFLFPVITTYFKNFLVNLADTAAEESPNDDIILSILTLVIPRISQFVQDKNSLIEISEKALIVGGVKDFAKDENYKNLFKPLLEELKGLAKWSLPQEDGIPKIANDLFDEILLGLISSNYETYIKPAAVTFNSVVNPSTLDYNTVLIDFPEPSQIIESSVNHSKTAVKLAAEMIGDNQTTIVDQLTAQALSVTRQLIPALEAQKMEPEIKEWISKRTEMLVNNEDLRVKKLWWYIENRVRDAFVTGFVDSPNEKKTTIVDTFVSTGLQTFSTFIEKHGAKVQVLYEETKADPTNVEKKQALENAFKPLIDSLASAVKVPGIELPDHVKNKVVKTLKEMAPAYLAENYRECLAPKEAIPALTKQLNDLLVEEKNIESKDTAEFIGKMCKILAAKLVPHIDKMAVHKLAAFLKIGASNFDNEKIRSLEISYLNEAVESVLLQAVVNYLQALKEEKGSVKGLKLQQILEKFGRTLQKRLKEDGPKYLELMDQKEPARSRALREAFAPLSTSLLKLFTKDKVLKATELPLIVPFADKLGDVWNKLGDEILPDVLTDMFLDSTSWISLMETNQQDLATRMKSANAATLSKNLSEWAADMVASHLTLNRDSFAKTIKDQVETMVKAMNVEGADGVVAFLDNYGELLEESVSDLLNTTLNRESRALDQVQPITQKALEAVFLEGLNRLTKRIEDVSTPNNPIYEKDFLLNLGTKFLVLAKEHFSTINTITKEAKKSYSYDVAHEEFIRGFKAKGTLRAMPLAENKEHRETESDKRKRAELAFAHSFLIQKQISMLSKNIISLRAKLKKGNLSIDTQEKYQQDIARMRKELAEAKKEYSEYKKEYFTQMTTSILEVIGIKGPNDLTFVPKDLRETLWPQFRDELLPNILGSVYDKILEPATIDKMALGGLTALHEALDAEDQVKNEFVAMAKDLNNVQKNYTKIVSALKKNFNTANAGAINDISKKIEKLDLLIAKADPRFYDKLRNDLPNFKGITKAIQEELRSTADSLQTIVKVLQLGANPRTAAVASKMAEVLEKQLIPSITSAEESTQKIDKFVEEELTVCATEDKDQEALNKTCGELVLEMTKLVPKSTLNALFSNVRSLEELSAITIGRAIRRNLGHTTLLDLLDKGFAGGIDVFTTDKVRANKMPTFNIPETDEELADFEIKVEAERAALEAETKEKMLKLSRKAATTTFFSVIEWHLTIVKRIYEWVIDKISDHPKFRKMFYVIGDVVHFILIGWIQKLLKLLFSFPITKKVADYLTLIPRKILDLIVNAWLKYHINNLYKNIHLSAHENLLFKMSDTFIEALKKKEVEEVDTVPNSPELT